MSTLNNKVDKIAGGIQAAIDALDAKLSTIEIAAAAAVEVSDVAYNATTWDAATTQAPSKNAMRDKLEADATALTNALALKADASAVSNVTNTSDADKPVSTAQQTALDLKANLVSPSFTTPILGTPASGNLSNCTGFPAVVVPAGHVVQVVRKNITASATYQSTTPALDDSIPLISEGLEVDSQAITCSSASNLVRVDVVLHFAANALETCIAALFQDAGSNAVAASIQVMTAANFPECFNFSYLAPVGTTSATTFSLRVGNGNNSIITTNGYNGNRRMGGVLMSSITITEIKQ